MTALRPCHAILLVLGGMTAIAAPAAAALACPPTLSGAAPGFVLLGTPPARPAPLSTIDLVDGPPGSEAERFPALLAPDTQATVRGRLTSVWDLAGYAPGGVLVVCRYAGTPAYLRAQLPAGTTRCTQTLEAGRRAITCG